MCLRVDVGARASAGLVAPAADDGSVAHAHRARRPDADGVHHLSDARAGHPLREQAQGVTTRPQISEFAEGATALPHVNSNAGPCLPTFDVGTGPIPKVSPGQIVDEP